MNRITVVCSSGLTAVSVICLLLAGCGSNKLPKPWTVPVRGSVLVKGKPMEGVRVTFVPDFELNYPLTAMTDKAGRFEMSTTEANDGIPLGDYAVIFERPVPMDVKGLDGEGDAWKGKYANPTATKHRVSIGEAVDLEPFRLE